MSPQTVAELEADLQWHQRMAQAANRGGQTAEEMAHLCLDDGCPVNTVADLIVELKGIAASQTRSAAEQHHIEQLLSALNTSLDHAGATQHTTGARFGGM